MQSTPCDVGKRRRFSLARIPQFRYKIEPASVVRSRKLQPGDVPVRPDDQDMIDRLLDGDRGALRMVDDWIAQAASPYRRRLADQWDDVLGLLGTSGTRGARSRKRARA